MNILSLVLLLASNLGYAFSCADPQVIHQMPIQFDKQRIALTRQYQLNHYGIKAQSIAIEPKMIVLHWTVLSSLKTTFRVFNPPVLPVNSPRRSDLPGDLNVSSHFIVDKDGSI